MATDEGKKWIEKTIIQEMIKMTYKISDVYMYIVSVQTCQTTRNLSDQFISYRWGILQ